MGGCVSSNSRRCGIAATLDNIVGIAPATLGDIAEFDALMSEIQTGENPVYTYNFSTRLFTIETPTDVYTQKSMTLGRAIEQVPAGSREEFIQLACVNVNIRARMFSTTYANVIVDDILIYGFYHRGTFTAIMIDVADLKYNFITRAISDVNAAIVLAQELFLSSGGRAEYVPALELYIRAILLMPALIERPHFDIQWSNNQYSIEFPGGTRITASTLRNAYIAASADQTIHQGNCQYFQDRLDTAQYDHRANRWKSPNDFRFERNGVSIIIGRDRITTPTCVVRSDRMITVISGIVAYSISVLFDFEMISAADSVHRRYLNTIGNDHDTVRKLLTELQEWYRTNFV